MSHKNIDVAQVIMLWMSLTLDMLEIQVITKQ
jgi:hypothetical protein